MLACRSDKRVHACLGVDIFGKRNITHQHCIQQ